MSRCRATKANGEACKGTATGSHGYCWAHAPENAEQRQRAASKAARSKPSREVRGYKQEVKDLIADVKAGGQDRADVAVMLQGYRVLKDLVELERKIKEQDDLAVRLEDLEAVLEHRNGGGIGYG
jgi:hypothetical protein